MPTLRAKYQRWSGSIAILALAIASAVGLHVNRERIDDNNREARARSSVDSARSAQLKWDSTDDARRTCIRTAKGRAEVRNAFDDVFDSIARFTTPERKVEVERFVAAEKMLIAEALPHIDCDQVAPRPKGPRPAIPGD